MRTRPKPNAFRAFAFVYLDARQGYESVAVDQAAAAGGWTAHVTTETDAAPGALAFPPWSTHLPG